MLDNIKGVLPTETKEHSDDTKKLDTDGVIEFVCEEKNYDVIPEPIPANDVLPDWYKQLSGSLDEGLESSSVKRCMPFLDAMTMGWIIPLCAETEMEYDTQKGEANVNWRFEEPTISSHGPEQIGGDSHPHSGKAILKFHNYWGIKVPDGYSVLFVPPLNRTEQRFQVFSGVVDCDNYFNYINFPFIWTAGDYHGVLDAGTPLIQAIPIKRDTLIGDGRARPMSDDESSEMNKQVRKLGVEESDYRDNIWQPKAASRTVKESESPEE